MYCEKCGKQIDDNATICTGCGCKVVNNDKSDKEINNNDKNTTNNGSSSIWLPIGSIVGALVVIMALVLFLGTESLDFETVITMGFGSIDLAMGSFLICYFGDKIHRS